MAKILVVDDEESILWLFKKALEKRNVSLTGAISNKAGKALVLTRYTIYNYTIFNVIFAYLSSIVLLTCLAEATSEG